jgi:hypothetical protein
VPPSEARRASAIAQRDRETDQAETATAGSGEGAAVYPNPRRRNLFEPVQNVTRAALLCMLSLSVDCAAFGAPGTAGRVRR